MLFLHATLNIFTRYTSLSAKFPRYVVKSLGISYPEIFLNSNKTMSQKGNIFAQLQNIWRWSTSTWPHILQHSCGVDNCLLLILGVMKTHQIFKVPLLWVMKGSYFGFGITNNRLTCMQGQKTLSLSYNMHLFSPYLLNDSQTIRSTIHFSKLLLCVTLLCSDWSISFKAVFVSSVLLCEHRTYKDRKQRSKLKLKVPLLWISTLNHWNELFLKRILSRFMLTSKWNISILPAYLLPLCGCWS